MAKEKLKDLLQKIKGAFEDDSLTGELKATARDIRRLATKTQQRISENQQEIQSLKLGIKSRQESIQNYRTLIREAENWITQAEVKIQRRLNELKEDSDDLQQALERAEAVEEIFGK